jgi:hypothetical protein
VLLVPHNSQIREFEGQLCGPVRCPSTIAPQPNIPPDTHCDALHSQTVHRTQTVLVSDILHPDAVSTQRLRRWARLLMMLPANAAERSSRPAGSVAATSNDSRLREKVVARRDTIAGAAAGSADTNARIARDTVPDAADAAG